MLFRSGHALRCGRSWAPLIDSSYYSAVFRTNWVGRNEASFAGRRVDFSLEPSAKRCQELKASGARCVPSALRRKLVEKTVSSNSHKTATGLGRGRSGGEAVSLALALCKWVDVYGSGMYSDGPGSDVVYQHYYDSRFTTSCRPHACLTSAQALELGLSARFIKDYGMRAICQPERSCYLRTHRNMTPGSFNAPTSDGHFDFFYLSELRMYVLHASGRINWVWYAHSLT